jgi:hypothetical protein
VALIRASTASSAGRASRLNTPAIPLTLVYYAWHLDE